MLLAGILFDKDGTLFDFRGSWLAAYHGVALELAELAGHDRAFAQELLRVAGYDPASDRFRDDSPLLWAACEEVAALWDRHVGLGTGRTEEIVVRHFGDHVRYPPVPVGDLPALLKGLRLRGYRIGLATMDHERNARRTLDRLGIADAFGFVAGSDSGLGRKPEPGMVYGFCERCHIPPERVMVVGDSYADMEMARNAGCGLAVAVRTGATPLAVLRRSADHVIESVQRLGDLLDRLEL